MPHIPKPGEALLSYNLATVAYRRPESMTELLKKAINIALENNVNFIHVTIDPSCPMTTLLSQFGFQTRMKLHVLTKPLKQARSSHLGENKIYLDVAEL
jgi:hypothetical protein